MDKQAFTFGFLKLCAERGLDATEAGEAARSITVLLRADHEKQAQGGIWPGILSYLGGRLTHLTDKGVDVGVDLAKKLTGLGIGATVGAALTVPPAAGALTGYLAGKATRTGDEDVEEQKQQELAAAYRSAAAELQRRSELARRRQQTAPPPARRIY